MSFTLIAAVKSFVADHTAKASGTLNTNWTSLCEQGQRVAYNDILAAFSARGFTKAQIDAWDRGEEFELDMAAYWALTHNAVTFQSGYDQATLDKLDRRKELWGDPANNMMPAPLLTGGVWVDPASNRGGVSFGSFREDDQVFGIEDESDPRRGQPTRL